MQALFYYPKVENYIMRAREKRKEKKVIPPYKIVVVCTYILNFLTH
jgi:hypothetical protein